MSRSSLATRPAGAAPGLVLGAAALLTGLAAGFIYAYSVSVMPGLAQADDRTLVDGMQQINEVTENPVFFLSFVGAPFVMAAALVTEHRSGSRQAVRWIAAALALYGVVFLVTGAVHFGLNDDLARAGDPDRIADLADVRDDFYGPWAAWNIVRTVASAAALGCLVYALILHGRAASGPAAPTQSAVDPRGLRPTARTGR
jgi:uncharacterized membrane protein